MHFFIGKTHRNNAHVIYKNGPIIYVKCDDAKSHQFRQYAHWHFKHRRRIHLFFIYDKQDENDVFRYFLYKLETVDRLESYCQVFFQEKQGRIRGQIDQSHGPL